MRYDPARPPDPEAWLALHEDTRTELVVEYHRSRAIPLANVGFHAGVHVIAESVVAKDNLGAREKLDELVSAGLDRHEALHALGTIFIEALDACEAIEDEETTEEDVERFYTQRIAALSAEAWRARLESQRQPAEHPGWIVELAYNIGELDDALRARILALGSGAVMPLLAVVEDELVDSYHGWRSVHAAALLGELADERAVDVLVRAIELSEPGESLCDRAIYSLIAIGEPVAAPLLARLEALRPDAAIRRSWYEVLAHCGVVDDRIFAHLTAALPGEPPFISYCLAEYGDRRALPLLHRELEHVQLTGDPLEDWVVPELVRAIESLGGDLTDAERTKFAIHLADMRRAERGPAGTA